MFANNGDNWVNILYFLGQGLAFINGKPKNINLLCNTLLFEQSNPDCPSDFLAGPIFKATSIQQDEMSLGGDLCGVKHTNSTGLKSAHFRTIVWLFSQLNQVKADHPWPLSSQRLGGLGFKRKNVSSGAQAQNL